MKRSSIFIVAAIALTILSCRKELVSNEVLTAQSSSESTAVITPAPKLVLNKATTNFGALIDSPVDTASYNFNMQVAGELGISCIRYRTPVPGSKKLPILSSSYNILLNFNSSGIMPMNFRTDLSTYENDLRNTIATLPALPLLAVIENEESNSLYYKGTAMDYVNQLTTAIKVFHSYNIPVANGGITSIGLNYLVYQDYVKRGMTTQANDFKTRMNVQPKANFNKTQGAFDSVLITNYAKMDLDFVNFHWRSQSLADSQGLGEVIAYLKRATGKPVITNEIGQFDQDPATLTSVLQTCQQNGCPFVIWYSDCEGSKSYPLNYSDATLTSTGYAYSNYIHK